MAGWAPSFFDCAVSGAPGPHSAFVVQLGGVVSDDYAPPGTPRLDADTLGLLGALLSGDWVTADSTADRVRSQASGIVAAYTQWHLERGLRSLQHVDRTTQNLVPRMHGSASSSGFSRASAPALISAPAGTRARDTAPAANASTELALPHTSPPDTAPPATESTTA
jgi:DNA repair protein RecO (recombination protein O)